MQPDYGLPRIEGFQPLAVPVPPMLEEAMGYTPFGRDEARFVTFFWSPFGDEAYFDDGWTSGTGDWQGFLAYVEHLAVWPALGANRFQLGSSEEVNTHRLLLDRLERKLYLVEDRAACLALSRQWPKSFQPETDVEPVVETAVYEAREVQPDEPPQAGGLSDLLDSILENWEQLKPPSQAKIEVYSRQRESVLSNLFLWLDAHPHPAGPKSRQNRPGGESYPGTRPD
jgi:hypothetical protein